MDHGYKTHRAWTGQDFGGKLPSEVFNEHIVTCFITDDFGVESRRRLDLDNVTWECDYPHSDTTWPKSPEVFWKTVDEEGVSDEDIDRISHLNAMQHYSFDPFSVTPRRSSAPSGPCESRADGHDTIGTGDRLRHRGRTTTCWLRSLPYPTGSPDSEAVLRASDLHQPAEIPTHDLWPGPPE